MAKKPKSPVRAQDLPVQSPAVRKKSKAANRLKAQSDREAYEKALEILNPPYQLSEEISLLNKGFSLTEPQLAQEDFPYGWILAAVTKNPTHDAIKSYTAQWLVPEPPLDDGHLLFVFIGISNATELVQCQLQWGHTNCGGGGGYWSIGCTQVHNKKAYCDEQNIAVNPGDVISASISLYRSEKQQFYYDLAITNGKKTVNMHCNYLIAPRDCSVVLESYGVERSENFPPNKYTTIDNIRIETVADKAMPIQWKNKSQQNPDGQHLAIPKIDRIALWYHALPVNPATLS